MAWGLGGSVRSRHGCLLALQVSDPFDPRLLRLLAGGAATRLPPLTPVLLQSCLVGPVRQLAERQSMRLMGEQLVPYRAACNPAGFVPLLLPSTGAALTVAPLVGPSSRAAHGSADWPLTNWQHPCAAVLCKGVYRGSPGALPLRQPEGGGPAWPVVLQAS